MARPPAARSTGEHTAAMARTVWLAVPPAFGPAQQGIAAQRDTDGEHLTAALGTPLIMKATQDPADLLVVAGVVGTWRAVDLTTAAAKVRHGIGQALLAREVGKGFGIVAARAAFQAVEQHKQALSGLGRRSVGCQPVDVDEIAVRAVPAFASVLGSRTMHAPRVEGWPDGLKMAPREPGRRAVLHRWNEWNRWPQCSSTCSGAPPSSASCEPPGLTWCTTMRQPWAVFW